jgi:predicted RNA binding protein YcfA (HicA-like mRNA interferase family)
MPSPVKIRDAHRELESVGAVLVRCRSSHEIWQHPSWEKPLTLPTHGSRGRTTISPGMSAAFRKAVALARS